MRIQRRVVQVFMLFLLAVWVFLQLTTPPDPSSPECAFEDRLPTEQLIFVNHAICRMDCRDVSRRTVEQVYLQGRLNCQKSSYKDGNPRYALEKRDARGDNIRLIVEDDDGKHVVITVIRLGKRDRCACS